MNAIRSYVTHHLTHHIIALDDMKLFIQWDVKYLLDDADNKNAII